MRGYPIRNIVLTNTVPALHVVVATRVVAVREAVLGQLYKHNQRGDHANLHPQLTTDYANILTLISGSDDGPQ